MSFNSSSDILCKNESIVVNLTYFLDNIETPIYFIVGLLSRLIYAFSIYREIKTDQAYLYQIYLLVAEFNEILFQFVSQLSQRLRIDSPGFQRCYACMFWDTRLTNVFASATKVNTNLLTLAMTLDRAYALREPIKYTTNRTVADVRKWMPLVSVLFSASSSLPFAFYYELVRDSNTGVYVQVLTEIDLAYVYTMISGVFELVLTLSNIGANVLLCYSFRNAMKQRAEFKRSSRSSRSDDDPTNTLFKITLCQSFCNTFASLITIAQRILVPLTISILPMAARCLSGPIVAASTELMDIVEFILMLAISKKFRAMVGDTVKNLVGCGSKTKVNQIGTIRVVS